MSLPSTRSEELLSKQVDVTHWDFDTYLEKGPAPSEDAASRFSSQDAMMAWDFFHNPKARDGRADALLAILTDITRPG